MSRVQNLDLALLRARLILAIEGTEGIPGSIYLLAIGSLLLAASPESSFEQGLWSSLFELQADEERVSGAAVLDALGSVSGVLS